MAELYVAGSHRGYMECVFSPFRGFRSQSDWWCIPSGWQLWDGIQEWCAPGVLRKCSCTVAGTRELGELASSLDLAPIYHAALNRSPNLSGFNRSRHHPLPNSYTHAMLMNLLPPKDKPFQEQGEASIYLLVPSAWHGTQRDLGAP